jgi:formylglycine-generating enzyme required for sulfatase activity
LDPAVVFLACRRVDGYEDLSDVVDKELENLRDIIGQRAEIIEVGNFRDFSDLLTDQKAAERLVGLHFIGHGDLAERRPFLTCPQDAGGAQLYRIYPQTLLQLLLQYRPSPLLWVFLEACRAGADDVSLAYPTGGFAASLSKLGVANCALAMRFEITSRFATTFSGSFYRNYIAGDRTTVPVAYRLARSQMSGFAEFSTELAAVSLFVNEVGEKISALGPRQQTKHKTDDLSMRSYAESLDGHTSSSDRLARAHLDTSAAGHVSNRSTVAQSPTRSGELNSVSGTRDRLVQIMSAHRWNSKEADELIDDITRALGATTEVDVRGSLTRQLSLIRMVRVPDGFYDIGYTDEHIQRITGALARKFPRQVVAQVRELLEKVKPRKIYVPALLVDRFPVTRDDFRRFVEIESYVTTAEATGSSVTWKTFASSDSASFPVVGVSYRDAQRYAQWAGKRLPTAEEWQVLVRCNDSRIYPWGWPFGEERCNTAESLAGQERSQVDRFHEGVDEWGCYDLVGNVEEWTSTADTRDPDAYRICGGSWKMTCEVFGLSGVYRTGGDSVFTDDLGFRCCRNETLDDSALFS